MMNVSLSFPQPSTFDPLLCTTKTQLLPSTPILFHHSVHKISQFVKKRHRFVTCVSSSELPLVPFPIDQVLIPSETKTLHLYEARYLALLEESLFKKKKFFVHFVLDPIAINDTSGEASFAARYGCLVAIEKVEHLEIGALVSIRGIGRVKILKFEQVRTRHGMITPSFGDKRDRIYAERNKQNICGILHKSMGLWATRDFIPSPPN